MSTRGQQTSLSLAHRRMRWFQKILRNYPWLKTRVAKKMSNLLIRNRLSMSKITKIWVLKSLACSKRCRLGPRKTLRSEVIRLLAIRSNWAGKRNQRMTPRQKNLKMRSVFTRDLNISTQYLQPARNRVFSSLKPTRRPYHMRANTSSEKAPEGFK